MLSLIVFLVFAWRPCVYYRILSCFYCISFFSFEVFKSPCFSWSLFPLEIQPRTTPFQYFALWSLGKNYCTTLINLHLWPVCHSDTPFCLLVKHYLISSLNQPQAWLWCPANHKVMWLCDDPRRQLPRKHASPAEWGLFWPLLLP